MKHTFQALTLALISTWGLSACDRPTMVAVPATPVVVPGTPGPAGATGATGGQGAMGTTGNTGDTGATGAQGTGTTIIVAPPASAPAN